jgi:hypothetical protein
VAIIGVFSQDNLTVSAWFAGQARREDRERPPGHSGDHGHVLPGQPHRLCLDGWASSPRRPRTTARLQWRSSAWTSRTTSPTPAGWLDKLAAKIANGCLVTVAIIGMFSQNSLTGSAWIAGRARSEDSEWPPGHSGDHRQVLPVRPHRLRLDGWARSPRRSRTAAWPQWRSLACSSRTALPAPPGWLGKLAENITNGRLATGDHRHVLPGQPHRLLLDHWASSPRRPRTAAQPQRRSSACSPRTASSASPGWLGKLATKIANGRLATVAIIACSSRTTSPAPPG